MNKPKRAGSHTSKVLDSLLSEITPQEQARTENKMLLAAKIDDARKAKGLSQNEFAKAIGQHPSVISKWLSGTHNFTADTLWDIGALLGVDFILVKEQALKVTPVVEYKIEVTSTGAFATGFVNPYTVVNEENQKEIDSETVKYG